MDDKDLFEAWSDLDQAETQVLKKNKGKYEEIAKRKSDDVFEKIKKNMYWELGTSAVLILFFIPYLLKFGNTIAQLTGAGIVLGVFLLAFKIYGGYFKEIKKLNQSSITTSLESKIRILSSYVKQINFYLTLGGPLGIIVGFGFEWYRSHQELGFRSLLESDLLLTFAIAMSLAIPLVWITKKAGYALYGKHLDHLKEIHQNLTENKIE